MRFAILFLLATSVCAQTANVIELDGADAISIQEAWNALQKAQAYWDFEKKIVEQKYTTVRPSDPEGSTNVPDGLILFGGSSIGCMDGTDSCLSDKEKAQRKADAIEAEAKRRLYRRGFENGFEFSKDFRFIVPKTYEPPKTMTPGLQFYSSPAVINAPSY